jgi:chaperonin GroEL
MTSETITFHETARSSIARGVNTLADAVALTLGPLGRNVILPRPDGQCLVANSGIVVAREIELDDHLENMGAAMVKEAASKSSEMAGDGTTTATVLARAIVREGLKYVAAGINPLELKHGVDLAVMRVVEGLKACSQPCVTKDEMAQVATLAANGDATIGELIAEAMSRVGPYGNISIEDGQRLKNELSVVDGMQFERGYLSHYFVNNRERQLAVLEDACVLICDAKLSGMAELLLVMERVAQEKKSLLVIAETVEGEALASLVVNSLRGSLNVVAVKGPGIGEYRQAMLQDIATLTGGTLISSSLGLDLKQVGLEHLGHAKRIEVSKDHTIIIGGAGNPEAIQARVRQIQAEVKTANSEYVRKKLQERAAKLVGGVAVIRIGAATEAALNEKRSRMEDAMRATRAAVDEGIVPGGGVALLRARKHMAGLSGANQDQQAGINILFRALEEPLRQILINAGIEPFVIIAKVAAGQNAFGYNAATGGYGDLLKMGVIDPARVTRCALQNAASVAGAILSIGVTISAESWADNGIHDAALAHG